MQPPPDASQNPGTQRFSDFSTVNTVEWWSVGSRRGAVPETMIPAASHVPSVNTR